MQLQGKPLSMLLNKQQLKRADTKVGTHWTTGTRTKGPRAVFICGKMPEIIILRGKVSVCVCAETCV